MGSSDLRDAPALNACEDAPQLRFFRCLCHHTHLAGALSACRIKSILAIWKTQRRRLPE
jgi:hypothetical protein